MTSKYSDFKEAMAEAANTNRVADLIANDLADNIIGRLRKVNHYKLRRMKRELQNYNAATKKWKN